MSWAVAITIPQAESRVAKEIVALGFECFFPMIRTSSVRRGRRVYEIEPLFRRYLFVRMCDAIYELLSVRQIIGFIQKTNSGIATASDAVIREIKNRCTGEGFLITPKQAKFITGQRVRPKSGALSNLVGVFDGLQIDNQESALFNLLGRSVRVSFAKGVLLAA